MIQFIKYAITVPVSALHNLFYLQQILWAKFHWGPIVKMRKLRHKKFKKLTAGYLVMVKEEIKPK